MGFRMHVPALRSRVLAPPLQLLVLSSLVLSDTKQSSVI